MPALRNVRISIDTNLNEVAITDSFYGTGEIYLDYHGKCGQPITITRANTDALNSWDCLIKFNTPIGETGFFKFQELYELKIDGVITVATDFDDLISIISPYIFASLGNPAPVGSVDILFQHNRAHRQFLRWPIDTTITAVSTTNLTSYTMWVDDVLVTPLSLPLNISKGARVFAQITHVGSGTATINLTCSGFTQNFTFQSGTYYYPRTMIHKENVKALTFYMIDTDQVIQGQGGTASFDTNVVFGDKVTDVFQMIWEPAHWNFTGQLTFGLNDLSLPYNTLNRYPRMRYCIMLDANAVKIWEFGVLKATITLAYNQMFYYSISSKYNAGLGAYEVTYRYSTNGTSYSLLYASLTTFNALDMYPDWATQGGYHAKHHPPLISYN